MLLCVLGLMVNLFDWTAGLEYLFKVHLDPPSVYFQLHFSTCSQLSHIAHINLIDRCIYAGHMELLIFLHKHLLLIYAYIVSSAWNPLPHLVNSTSSFISYLKYHQPIWEAFLKGPKQN